MEEEYKKFYMASQVGLLHVGVHSISREGFAGLLSIKGSMFIRKCLNSFKKTQSFKILSESHRLLTHRFWTYLLNNSLAWYVLLQSLYTTRLSLSKCYCSVYLNSQLTSTLEPLLLCTSHTIKGMNRSQTNCFNFFLPKE